MTEDHSSGLTPAEVHLQKLYMFKLGQLLTEILGGADFVLVHNHHPDCPVDAISSVPDVEKTKAMLLAAVDRLSDPDQVNITADPRLS